MNTDIQSPTTEEIASRLARQAFMSVFDSFQNPDETLKRIGGQYKNYNSLLFDAHLSAAIRSRKSGTLAYEWMIRNNSEDPEDEVYLFVHSMFQKLNITQIIEQILDAPLYGFQPLEVLWQPQESKWAVIDVVAKPLEYFTFSNHGELKFVSLDNQTGKVVPPFKFLLPRVGATYDNPYGQAALSRCYFPVLFKKATVESWRVFTEKYGMPYFVAAHEFGTDKKRIDELADSLQALVEDAVLLYPKGTDVRIEQTGSTISTGIFKELSSFLNAEVSKAILGQTLTTEVGTDGSGSYAAARAHLDVRSDIIESDRRLVEQTINELIRWIIQLNFSSETMPTFSLYQTEDVDMATAQRDEILSKTGIKLQKSYYMRIYGLLETDFELAENSPQKSQFEAAGAVSSENAQKLIDALADSLSETELLMQSKKAMRPIYEFIQQQQSFEDLLNNLTAQFPRIDTEKLQTMLETQLHASYALGTESAER
jgi:phage gp29-like protein